MSSDKWREEFYRVVLNYVNSEGQRRRHAYYYIILVFYLYSIIFLFHFLIGYWLLSNWHYGGNLCNHIQHICCFRGILSAVT